MFNEQNLTFKHKKQLKKINSVHFLQHCLTLHIISRKNFVLKNRTKVSNKTVLEIFLKIKQIQFYFQINFI
jgi:hypothetical protein